MSKDEIIKDSIKGGWVERMPEGLRPYLRLSRYDRPIGFWLLALPGWIGLAFASLSHGFSAADIKWTVLIGIGAIAMRGAGCTYNDIVDRDLDKQVERTALRPLAAGTISVKSAWVWLALQCLVGFAVLMFFPRLSQVIAISSLALVAAYPFMKRITFWPQAWLGLTFNWAVLVAFTAKTGEVTPSLLLLYVGLIFWTIGYDTIYACQDIEDDAMIGVKSTARLFGDKVRLWVGIAYVLSLTFTLIAFGFMAETQYVNGALPKEWRLTPLLLGLFPLHLVWQVGKFDPQSGSDCLKFFKTNQVAGLLLIITFALPALTTLLSSVK